MVIIQKIYNNNSFGFLLGVSGYSLFVFLDTIIKKYLVQQYPIFEITFFICLFSFIPILATLTVVGNWNRLINNKIHIQILRGILVIICGSLIINSFRYHALFEIYPVLFATPLILTSLSYFVLKEKSKYTEMVSRSNWLYRCSYSISTRNLSFYFSNNGFIYWSFYSCY